MHSTLCLQNRHAGYSFRSLFHNRLDSHRYLGSKGWPATSTSMWLQPPPSGGGARWIATQLLQRRPRARFCCELLRASRNAFVQLKTRHRASQSTPMWRCYFPPGERDPRLADYSSTPALRQSRDVRNSVQALLRRRRAKLSQTNLTDRARGRALSTALSTRAPFSARVRQREISAIQCSTLDMNRSEHVRQREQIRIGLNAIEALYQLR